MGAHALSVAAERGLAGTIIPCVERIHESIQRKFRIDYEHMTIGGPYRHIRAILGKISFELLLKFIFQRAHRKYLLQGSRTRHRLSWALLEFVPLRHRGEGSARNGREKTRSSKAMLLSIPIDLAEQVVGDRDVDAHHFRRALRSCD